MFGPVSHIHAATDVLVTGIGLVTPLGLGRQKTWDSALQGKRAGRRLLSQEIDHFQQLTELLKRDPAGAPIDHPAVRQSMVRCEKIFESPDARRQFDDTWGQDCLNNMMAFCLNDALSDSQLDLSQLSPERTSCVIGTSKPSLRSIEGRSFEHQWPSDFRYPRDDLWTSGFMPDSPLRTIEYLTGARGPGGCPIAACATGLFSVIEGAAMIRSGQCDVCIVGSADASLRSSVLAAFHRLGVTSRHNDPQTACRPFDVDRDGFIIGEGAGLAILESRANAERRYATAYCQITHGLSLTDPTGMTQIDSSGGTVAELLRRLAAPFPDFISVHGTGTESNDQAEAQGIAKAYYSSDSGRPVCFGIKGAMGHMLGAAASVEFGLTCLGMKHSKIPPTSNFQNADDACPIQVTGLPSETELNDVQSAVKLSLGFGGHVVGCVVKSVD